MKRHSFDRQIGYFTMVLLVGAWSAPVSSQTTYKCQANGSTYYADRPCNKEAGIAVGSTEVKVSTKVGTHDLGAYLQGRCASLYDQIKSLRATVHGSAYGRHAYYAVEEARSKYEQTCQMQDSAARQKMRMAIDAQQYAQFMAQESQEKLRRQAAIQEAQCAEMGRIYKRKTANLSDMSLGERQDFARFEQGFKARCLDTPAPP
jgi:hypothetical protein